ncbi:hypothetical protein ACFVQ9_26435 [Streptomyces goshikiensis]|uniref:hypothetical protein n=1 Tax=Streptomyces goshikiensis TaxID=1942 RepID=UPI0036A14BCB
MGPAPQGRGAADALAVPNADEALLLTADTGPRDLAGDADRAARLLSAWPVTQVAVTRGSLGAVLVANPDAHP